MKRENGQVKSAVGATADTDFVTLAHMKAQPKAYYNGVLKTDIKFVVTHASVASGKAVFYLTDNGLAGGAAVFTTQVFTESINLAIFDAANQYQYSNVVISADRKTLTVDIGRLGTVILGLIQFLTAANGVNVNLTVRNGRIINLCI